jgi:hypothetical protein
VGEGQSKLGSVGIVANAAGKYMQVTISNKTYVYYPISTRYNVQIEVPPSLIKEEEPELSSPPPPGPPECEFDDCKSVLTILVLVTDEAVDEILGKYQGLTTSPTKYVSFTAFSTWRNDI